MHRGDAQAGGKATDKATSERETVAADIPECPPRKPGGDNETQYGEADLVTHFKRQVLRLHANEMHAPDTHPAHRDSADEDVTDTYFTVLGFSAYTRRGQQCHVRTQHRSQERQRDQTGMERKGNDVAGVHGRPQ
ncbi:hypothetical protein D3C71_1547390 [compost metagenome]